VQKMTPEGGQRGRVFASSGGGPVFKTGTKGLEWKLENELAEGPNGLNGMTCSSEAKTEAPSLVCVVVTSRAWGSWFDEDILLILSCNDNEIVKYLFKKQSGRKCCVIKKVCSA